MGDVSSGRLKPPGGGNGGNSNWGSNGSGGWQDPAGYVITHTRVSYSDVQQAKDAREHLISREETKGYFSSHEWPTWRSMTSMPILDGPAFTAPIDGYGVLGAAETVLAAGILARDYFRRGRS